MQLNQYALNTKIYVGKKLDFLIRSRLDLVYVTDLENRLSYFWNFEDAGAIHWTANFNKRRDFLWFKILMCEYIYKFINVIQLNEN